MWAPRQSPERRRCGPLGFTEVAQALPRLRGTHGTSGRHVSRWRPDQPAMKRPQSRHWRGACGPLGWAVGLVLSRGPEPRPPTSCQWLQGHGLTGPPPWSQEG